MKTLITETFRRIVATVPDVKFKKYLEDDIKRLLSLPNFLADFKEVKTEIKPSVKDDVLVIDITGEGADSVSRKIKDLAVKHKATVKIRNEKPMSPGIKEGLSYDLNWKPEGWTKELYTDGERWFDEKGEPRTDEEWKEEWYKHHINKNKSWLDKNKSVKEGDKMEKFITIPSARSFITAKSPRGVTYPLKAKVIKNIEVSPPSLYNRYEVEINGERYFVGLKNENNLKEGKAMPNIIGSVLDKLQDELGPEVANPLWKEKAADITNIINSVRKMAGTSTGQKVDAAVSQIKKLQSMNEGKSKDVLQQLCDEIDELELASGGSVENGVLTIYLEDPNDIKVISNLIRTKFTGKINKIFSEDDVLKYRVANNQAKSKSPYNENQMNENKKLKVDLRKMIVEALEQVKAEAKGEKEEETPEVEDNSEEGTEKPKAKKLEKDEIGKFYVVTRPTKADDNIVHETNVLDLITKIKSGEIDGSRILGAFKKRGGANGLAKVQLKQISAELDELKQHMEEFRASKKTLNDAKEKAKQTIQKYKPNSDETEEVNV